MIFENENELRCCNKDNVLCENFVGSTMKPIMGSCQLGNKCGTHICQFYKPISNENIDDKKCYIVEQSAETTSKGIVELTDTEYRAVKHFLEQVGKFARGWCGWCSIEDKGYSTKDEANRELYKEFYKESE